jgi:DNA-binding NtrC family response regulator/tetratricopeptide (TPR) repeat protein
VIVTLLAEHPQDRPGSAREVLALLGRVADVRFEASTRGAHVHEDVVTRLLEGGERVIWVVGPSGSGKSHLAREVVARALLSGKETRVLRFPEDAVHGRELLAFLRTEAEDAHLSRSELLLLDDVHDATPEVRGALESFRCRIGRTHRVRIVVTAREAPRGAPFVTVGALDRRAFETFAQSLGVEDDDDRTELFRATGGLPGWAVATLGRVPLTRESALARLEDLPSPSRDALALVAVLGGRAPLSVLDPDAVAPAYARGLLVREEQTVRLVTAAFAEPIASALAGESTLRRAAELVLADGASFDAASTWSVARARQTDVNLFTTAAARARLEGARSIEIDALTALGETPRLDETQRASALLRLERLLRDAGTRAHPGVLDALERLATKVPSVRAVATRRRAEERARAGDRDAARRIAEAGASEELPPAELAYTHATAGSVALFGAEWAPASRWLRSAESLLARVPPHEIDAEEQARLQHNLGVVALYEDRPADAVLAFQRSVDEKRALGDLAGVRACLSNLGTALAKLERFDEAEAAFASATALAESLGQEAGRAWTLAARADVALQRGDSSAADGFVAEARALGDAVPASIVADLHLLAARVALFARDLERAREEEGGIDAAVRAEDALVDARACIVAVEIALASVPVDRPRAIRSAVAAVRRARAAGLREVEREGVAALARARAARPRIETGGMPAMFDVLTMVAHGDAADVPKLVARHVAEASGAERTFVVVPGEGDEISAAWGVDLDGIDIGSATERVDFAAFGAARRARGPVHARDVETRGGRGARLAIAGRRAVVVVEHRFRVGAFDALSAEEPARWATLADLAVRIWQAGDVPVSRTAQAVALPDPPPQLTTTALRREGPTREYPGIVGTSPALRRALAELDAAVSSELPTLVRGETGTGKELFASAVHEHGSRGAGPFIAVNCGAITESLFEAELFGHARGAFTGAERARAGMLTKANGGTLFLDEVGELPLSRQATLLRALETRRLRAVGSDEETAFDVRIVAATNRDLDACVEAGTFRRDLLYRLRVLEIVVPPLRDRRGDVEVLLLHFLRGLGSRASPTDEALRLLDAHPWPGNVRELANLAQRVAASGVTRLDPSALPRAVRAAAAVARGPALDERAEVEDALRRTGGNISHAATLLGLTRHGLKKRMLRVGVRARVEGKP